MDSSALAGFHPLIAQWFSRQIGAPTAVQQAAWPVIASRQSALIAAPTGAGKTFAAFLAAINDLLLQGLQARLPQATQVLYISPLKALSNDIQKNLQLPLNGIRDQLLESGLPDVPISAWVRSGDTSAAERERMRRHPPHIMVTTPESFYILLTSVSGREMLGQVRTVIVDEIHALAGNKRGAHLLLSLQRLTALCQAQQGAAPIRIGISATQKSIHAMAQYLMGEIHPNCAIIDSGHQRERDLALELTASPLTAVMANEVWDEVYQRLAELISQHRTTLIFVNTRRLAERAAHHLAQRVGEEAVTAHHGSLARQHRLNAEQRLKAGQLRALVATASLELGIDIGEIDLVVQLGSPRSIATLLQRVGRSGHRLAAMPKGRLFPLSLSDLVECSALLAAIQRDELDTLVIPAQPLDVLAQQIVAEIAASEWNASTLYECLRGAWPYRDLSRTDFDSVVHMLSEGYSTRRGRRGAYLFYDRGQNQLRARRGARLVALTNGGAIPDQFDYDVILQPEGSFIGTLNEDFAFESIPGDVFQLGNTAYRMHKIEKGKVYVEDAHGQPPNIPFWFGEAPGRSLELSRAVSDLLGALNDKLAQGNTTAEHWLQQTLQLPNSAAQQLTGYLYLAKHVLGRLPTQDDIILERFFDETGDMHLVIHSAFGTRINRAWGLALRKRFCRKFNFELQAAATDNQIILSLGPTHSFPLDEVVHYLQVNTLRQVLIQAVLDAPMFNTRWRWNCNISLAVLRRRGGKRVAAQFQRSDAEDLVALVFPDQLACLENIAGDRQIPDHPLVCQTLHDCLHDSMDCSGLEALYQRIQDGAVRLHYCDLSAPSVLCGEIINARPYAFLDDGAAEERRTHNIQQRQLDAHDSHNLRRLDPQLIDTLVNDLWPTATTPVELHEAIYMLGFITQRELTQTPAWASLAEQLQGQQRIATVRLSTGEMIYIASERRHEFAADLIALIRSRLEFLGPVTVTHLAASLALPAATLQSILLALEQQGFVIRGQFHPAVVEQQWCERQLLARLHRQHVQQQRRRVEPVSPQLLMRFLFDWHHLSAPRQGVDALFTTLEQLEGFPLPAKLWENDILPLRLRPYFPHELDQLCNSGRLCWQRVLSASNNTPKRNLLRTSPIAFFNRRQLSYWQQQFAVPSSDISPGAHRVLTLLQQRGALFFDELQHECKLLRTQLEELLAELVANALISADNMIGLRALMIRNHPRWRNISQQQRPRLATGRMEDAGRWSALNYRTLTNTGEATAYIARVLLRRYGVVFRKLLDRETNLPPWRELLYELRRMEAREEILGGRFVSGMSGEQFALPHAAIALRGLRNAQEDRTDYRISVNDPLNLTGIITPGERIGMKSARHVLYRNGLPMTQNAPDRDGLNLGYTTMAVPKG
ncbi:MAG: DEAD/DEAH box helicase [Gammaproteobacteria bacterium]|nr:DEAD/DEAH box helicase [Gammaproteobacteria bacterium]